MPAFGQAAAANAAAGPVTNVFGSPTQGTLFSTPTAGSPAANNAFGGAPMGGAASVFGGANPQTPLTFGGQAHSAAPARGLSVTSNDATATKAAIAKTSDNGKPAPLEKKLLAVYSQLQDLTEAERTQFEAPKFILGKIPLCPPPKELVNR